MKSINVTVAPYDSIIATLKALVASGQKVGVDRNKCNAELDLHIKDSFVNMDNMLETIKACKT